MKNNLSISSFNLSVCNLCYELALSLFVFEPCFKKLFEGFEIAITQRETIVPKGALQEVEMIYCKVTSRSWHKKDCIRIELHKNDGVWTPIDGGVYFFEPGRSFCFKCININDSFKIDLYSDLTMTDNEFNKKFLKNKRNNILLLLSRTKKALE